MNGLVRSGLAVVAASALVGLAGVGPAAAAVDNAVFSPNSAAPGATVSVSALFGDSDWATGEKMFVNLSVSAGTQGTFDAFPTAANPAPGWATLGSCGRSANGETVFCEWEPQGLPDSGQQAQLEVPFTIDPSASAGTITVTARSTIVISGPDKTDSQVALLAVVPVPTQTANPTPTPTVPATPTLAPTDGAGSGAGGEAGTAGTTAEVPTAVPAGEGPLDSSGNGALPWAWVALLTGVGAAGAAATIKVRAQRRAASH